MSNNLRTRNRRPFNLEDGLRVKGIDLSTAVEDLLTNQANQTDFINSKDSANTYPGLTAFKINFMNLLGTVKSYISNANTQVRTYTFQDRSGVIADDSDITGLFNLISEKVSVSTHTTDLATKANAIDVNTALGQKVSSADMVNALAAKVDVSVVSAISTATKIPLADVNGQIDASWLTAASGLGASLPSLVQRLRTGANVKWLIVASSSTAGYLIPTGSNTVEYPAAGNYQDQSAGAAQQMIRQLHAKYSNPNFEIINRGVAGAGMKDMAIGGLGNTYVPPMADHLSAYSPDVLIFNINSNDLNYGRTPAEFETYARDVLRAIRAWGGIAIVVPPMAQRDFNPASDYFKYRGAMYRACADYGIPVAPVENTLLNSQGTALIDTYDGLHPNATGAEKIGRAFAALFPAASAVASLRSSPEKEMRGDWLNPRFRGGFYEWMTATGDTRRSHIKPLDDLDGYQLPLSSAPGNLMRPNAIMFSTFSDGSGSTVANGARLSPDMTLFGAGATWDAAGLHINTGNMLRIPLDTRNRLKMSTGRDCFTASILFRIDSEQTVNVIARRQGTVDNNDVPVSVARVVGSTATLQVFPGNLGIGTGGALAIGSYHLLTLTTRGPMADANGGFTTTRTRMFGYLDGLPIGYVDSDTTRTLMGDTVDWTINGRWMQDEMTSIASLGSMSVSLLSISKDYFVTAEIEATWYVKVKVWAALRGITLP